MANRPSFSLHAIPVAFFCMDQQSALNIFQRFQVQQGNLQYVNGDLMRDFIETIMPQLSAPLEIVAENNDINKPPKLYLHFKTPLDRSLASQKVIPCIQQKYQLPITEITEKQDTDVELCIASPGSLEKVQQVLMRMFPYNKPIEEMKTQS